MNEIPEKALLSENERAILDLFAESDFIVRKNIETTLSLSQAMAVRLLKGLLDKGEIRVIGGGKNTRYVLNK
jgi:ATP-dependent DNA helicase RecG